MLPKSSEDLDAEDQVHNTIPGAETERFKKQIEFLLEADKLKHIQRQTLLLDCSRRENSTEHSWHIALMVLIMSEYSKETDIDFFHVMKMLLVHDLVEIDAGDTYCYDDDGRKDQTRREEIAADRIFGLLPADQAAALRALWDEFENRETPESRFANALDRVQPLLNNYFTNGKTWQENDIKSSQVHRRMRPVKDGAPLLWDYVTALIEDAVKKGILAE
ncbi:MAG: HD domain-containing protein [Desulfobacterales bacterium]|nr:MAG: HD domain-containing protein [Desulfobacterales bacterium]